MHRCLVRISNFSIAYGNEFVTGMPIVSTPQVDKYRLCIAENLYNQYGSVLHGMGDDECII